MRTPRYELLQRIPMALAGLVPENAVIIRDQGPHDKYPTVTNGAEEVVSELRVQGQLKDGQRLFYFDSERQLDEILIKDGGFAGFAPGPRRQEAAS